MSDWREKAIIAEMEQIRDALNRVSRERDAKAAEARQFSLDCEHVTSERDQLRAQVYELEQSNEGIKLANDDVHKLWEAAKADADRMRPVFDAAKAWRENAYRHNRSWTVPDECDSALVSAIDTAAIRNRDGLHAVDALSAEGDKEQG